MSRSKKATGTEPGRGRGSASVRPARQVARVERRGQAIVVQPASCAGALASLVTARHLYHPHAVLGGRIVDQPVRLFGEQVGLDGPELAMKAGLEPVIVHLLERAGYAVEVEGTPSPIHAPDLAAVEQHGPVDRPLLDLVRQHDRGLVRYDGRHVDPVQLAAQVALAYPTRRIAIIAMRIDEVLRIARRLRAQVPETDYITGDHLLGEVGRVVVTTPWTLGRTAVEHWRRQIAIVIDPVAALGGRTDTALQHMTRARIYGLMDRAARAAPRDRDHLVDLYGLRVVVIPRHGHRLRPVEAESVPIVGGPPLASGLDVIALKRAGLWRHPVRNRRVVRAAVALERGHRRGSARESGALAERLAGVAEPRIAIVVESLEHALYVQQTLPRWPLMVGADADATGLGRLRGQVLAARRWLESEPPDRAIVTYAGLGRLDVGDYDAIVRADGGAGIPGPLAAGLITARADHRPLVLVDCDDRHHPQLRRWSRSRRDAYAERGWMGGIDPLEAAIERFLAERPEVDS